MRNLGASRSCPHCSRVHIGLPRVPVHPSNFSIPIALYNQNVFLGICSIFILELLTEVVDLVNIVSRCRCINLYCGDIEKSCSQAD